ncbi:hypothetical protein [Acinetobacter radioresistens]
MRELENLLECAAFEPKIIC